MGAHARTLVMAAVLLALLLAACGRPRIQTPEGFAPIANRRIFRAVSPEGVRFQVRRVKNEPRQELAFWADALRTQLVKQGYRPSGEPQSFEAARGGRPDGRGGHEGRLFEWVMPYGTETWSYLTGVLIAGKRIVIVEAAGERTLYQKHRAAMLASLQTLAP